jgi:hypothetical protein
VVRKRSSKKFKKQEKSSRIKINVKGTTKWEKML